MQQTSNVFIDDIWKWHTKALTNEATVPRVGDQAIKVSTYCLLQIEKQKSSLLSDKSNRYEVFGSPVAWSTVGCWVDPVVEFRFLHVIFNNIHSRVGDEHRRFSNPCLTNNPLSFFSETQTKLVSLWSEIKKSAPVCALTLLDHSRASFKEAIFNREPSSVTVSADASVRGTSSKCWKGVLMNSPSISMYWNKLRWLTIYSSSPCTVTIFPLTGYLSFWCNVEVTAPALWIQGRPSKQE